MRVRITTLTVILLVCCLCFDTVAFAQEPVMNDDVIEESGTEPAVQESGSEETCVMQESKITAEESEGTEGKESAEEENVIQVHITSAGVSQTASATVQPVPKSKKVRVLMVGNSITYSASNRTISNLKKLAKKAKRKLTVKRLTYNNEKMVNWANPKHKNGKRLYKEIRSGKWDYIVLQEQTDAAVKPSLVDASKKLAAYIRKTSPKTQIIYNCTWAYKKGRKVSGKRYSFSSMQKAMNQNYEAAAQQTGGRVCRSGEAFLKYRKSKGKKKNLYRKDNNHASRYGWYLNACCLYSSIFGKSPVESRYYGGIGKSLAKKLQRVAASQM